MSDKDMPETTPETTPTSLYGAPPKASVGWVNGVQEIPAKTGPIGVLVPPRNKSVVAGNLEWATVIFCIVFGSFFFLAGYQLVEKDEVSRWVGVGSILSGLAFLIPLVMSGIFNSREKIKYSRLVYNKAITGMVRIDYEAVVIGEPVEYSEYKVKRRWWLVGLITVVMVFVGLAIAMYGLTVTDQAALDAALGHVSDK